MDPALPCQKACWGMLWSDIHAIMPGARVEVNAFAFGYKECSHVIRLNIVAACRRGKIWRVQSPLCAAVARGVANRVVWACGTVHY